MEADTVSRRNIMTKSFQLGDRVMYAREFLRNTGQMTGEVPFDVGTVINIKAKGEECEVCAVQWDSDRRYLVRSSNLIRESEKHLESR